MKWEFKSSHWNNNVDCRLGLDGVVYHIALFFETSVFSVGSNKKPQRIVAWHVDTKGIVRSNQPHTQ